MDIRERLADHAVIGLDTAVFIYHFETHPRYVDMTTELLAMIESGEKQGVISTVLLMELTVHPWRENQSQVARHYEGLLVNFPNLQIVDVTRSVARKAAQIRAEHNIRPADALHVATAVAHGATAFVGNDKQLARLKTLIDPICLERW